MSFKTHMVEFSPWNTEGDVRQNVYAALSIKVNADKVLSCTKND